MERFAEKIVELSILDVWQSSENAFANYFKFSVFYTIFVKRSTLDLWQRY